MTAAAAALSLVTVMPGASLAASPQRFEQIRVNRKAPGLRDAIATVRGTRTIEIAVQLAGQPVAVRQGLRAEAGRPMSAAAVRSARQDLVAKQRGTAARLRALGANVEATYTDVFNGFRIRVRANRVERIRKLPNVTAVLAVPRHVPSNATTVPYIGADRTWGQTGRTGKGVKIAIIDTGINFYHSAFGGKGQAAWKADNGKTISKSTFPTAKVVGGWDFVGDAYDGDTNLTPKPDPNPLDCKKKDAETVQHGTHVAATAAGFGVKADGTTYKGSYGSSTLSKVDFSVGPGVAPEAKLLAYRVFGCSGGTFLVVDALERAVRDGADVINMSLGSDFGEAGTLDAVATDNAVLAGVTVVASSGNAGGSAYMTGSPAAATRAISVAAMDAVASFPGAKLDMATGSDIVGINANGASLPVSGKLKIFKDDPSTSVDPATGKGDESLGCFPQDYTYNGFQSGQIAVVTRGICARVDRATQGQKRGAAAVIMINTDSALPPYENVIPGVTIPFIGVRAGARSRLDTDKNKTITIKKGGTIANETYREAADFTSAGPRRGDSAIKPDVAAPGVSVFSADGGTTTGGKVLSGTSMASPAVAGVAALVKQAHPNWTPREIKAAIVGTAANGKVAPYDVRVSGAGVIQPRRAVDTKVFAYTQPGASSLSFGSQAAQNRAGTSKAFSETLTVTLRNTSTKAIRYDLTNKFAGAARGVQVSLSTKSVTVPAKGRVQVKVTVSMAKSAVANLPAAAPNHEPRLAVDSAGALYTPLTTVAGAIVATPRSSGAGIYALRVPWLVAPHGLSDVRVVNGSQTAYTKSGTDRSATVRFRNYGLHKGIVDVYAWGLQDGRDNIGDVDLRAAGVASVPAEVCTGTPDSSDRCLMFAINTWTGWSNAAANIYQVTIDADSDPDPDYAILIADDGLLFTGFANGILDALIIDYDTGDLIDGFYAVAPADGSTMIVPALASDFGLKKSGRTSFDYVVDASTQGDTVFFDEMTTGNTASGASEWARFDAWKHPISNGFFKPLKADKVVKVPLKVNADTYRPNRGHKGWLVVSLDDKNGASQADMLPVGTLP